MQLDENEVLEDMLMDGLKIVQNVSLYRFTSDSVLLSRFASARVREVAADFCAGSGIVGIHFLALNPSVESLTLFEMQPELYSASKKTIEYNSLKNVEAVNIRVQDIGPEYDGKFSLILCNPPYEKCDGGFSNKDYKKAICRKELTVTLSEVLSVAAKKLKFGGRLAIINRADRTAEMLFQMKLRNLEPKRLQFVSGSADAKPYLVMVEARKGGKEGVEILPTLINNKE